MCVCVCVLCVRADVVANDGGVAVGDEVVVVDVVVVVCGGVCARARVCARVCGACGGGGGLHVIVCGCGGGVWARVGGRRAHTCVCVRAWGRVMIVCARTQTCVCSCMRRSQSLARDACVCVRARAFACVVGVAMMCLDVPWCV